MGDSGNAASQSSGGDKGGFAPASATAGPSTTGLSGYASETTSIGRNALGDFSRAPLGPSMSERPGYTHVNSNVGSNANGDFSCAPQGPSMTERPGYAPANPNISNNAQGDFIRVPQRPNSSNVPATTTNDWSHHHHQQPTIGNPYRPHVPIQPDEPKHFQIFVQSFTNSKTYTFEVRGTDTVEKLKGMIETKIGVAKSQQRLDYEGKPLEDRMTLSHYGIHARSTMHLNGRLRGG